MIPYNSYFQSTLRSLFTISNAAGDLLSATTTHAIHFFFFNLINTSKEEFPSAFCYFAAKNLFYFVSDRAISLITDGKNSNPYIQFIASTAISIFSAKYLISSIPSKNPDYTPISTAYIITLEFSRRFKPY